MSSVWLLAFKVLEVVGSHPGTPDNRLFVYRQFLLHVFEPTSTASFAFGPPGTVGI